MKKQGDGSYGLIHMNRPPVCEFTFSGESVVFTGKLFSFTADRTDASFVCTHEKAQFITFSSEMHATGNTLLSEIRWLDGEFEKGAELVKQSTSLSDNFLFVRKNGVSFIFSLDFPYSRIDGCTISYNPDVTLEIGGSYIPHSLTVTACRLSGVKSGLFDIAEIEAASDYVENRHPVRFERSMNIMTGITNRMTYCRENMIFYSMYDNPTLTMDIETIYKEIDLCEELGIEYYQLFEGVFDWIYPEKTRAALEKLAKYAASKDIKIGDYVHPGELYCPHYNYENRKVEKPEWRIRRADGQTGQLCLGCDEYQSFIKQRLVEHNIRHGEKLICMDMLYIEPCYNEKHGHPQGDVYKQVAGLVDLMEALNEISCDYLCWTNSGNWIEFMPKLVWYNQNIYLTDPHPREYVPVLNALKYLGDCRREQMVTIHEKYMVPYRFYTNCEYYLAPRSRISDIRYYEYSLLQSLAVTPNACFGEIRTFIDRMPHKQVPEFKKFIRKWLCFIGENYEYWKKTIRCGDLPGTGAIEIYSHIISDSGYICLVNQNTFPVTANVRLDCSIGLDSGDRFELAEIYSHEFLLCGSAVPYSSYGDAVDLKIGPESVRYIKISPFKETQAALVFGAECVIQESGNGYEIYLEDEQGITKDIVLYMKSGERLVSVSARHISTVKMYTFDTKATIISQKDNIAIINLQFPRRPAIKEVTEWTRGPGGGSLQLPADGFGFQGGLISGCFSEKQKICLDIVTEKCTSPDEGTLRIDPERINSSGHDFDNDRIARHNKVVKHRLKETLTTEFFIPFIEPMDFGTKPSYDNDCVMLLAFDDPSKVSGIKVWLDGSEIEVRKYRNAMKRDWFTYYIELTDNINPGLIKMTIEINWID
ncbi:MAG: alpha-amylase family protein [Saccharofermentanales bacterium]